MYKAFIIDDEPFARARIKELIDWEDVGFSIVGEASNGEDAFNEIVQILPDLVLTDIRMPVFSGLELIRRAIPSLPNCRFIIFSGYSDFEYAHEAIKYGVKSYLLKPINEHELKNAVLDIKKELDLDKEHNYILDKSFIALKEKWVEDILNNNNPEELQQRAMEMGFEIKNCLFTVLIIDIEDAACLSEEEIEEEEPILSTLVSKIVAEVFHLKGEDFIINEGYNRFVILRIFNKNCLTDNRPDKLADMLWEKCNSIWKEQVTVGYSDVVDSISSVRGCYKRTKTAIEGKFVLGKNRVIGFENVTRDSSDYSWNKLTQWNRIGLDEAIQSLDLDSVRAETKMMFDFLKTLIHEPTLIKGIITENIVGVLRILIKLDGDVSEVVGENFSLDSWLEKYTLEELEIQFNNICLKISDYISKVRKNRPQKIGEKMKGYIRKNYSKNISLKGIAREFYMNPVYLGQLFKNDTGRLFHEYLTEVRMKAARKLLTETDLTVELVAERCGYNVVRNFYLAFKKHYKCTPNEFRMGHMEPIKTSKINV